MLRLLKHFWRSLLAVGALVGLIYLPADIVGIPTVVMPFVSILSSINREWLLIGFGAVVSLYIVWMDARPFLTLWISKRRKSLIQVESVKHSIEIDPDEAKERNKPPQGKFRRVYRLPVRNNSERTLRRVQVAFSETGPYGRLPLIGDERRFETDLHPGEVANFRLGEADLGIGSTLNLFDDDDERYATVASFRSDTMAGCAFTSGTRLRGPELERVSQLKPERGFMSWRISLIASAEDARPESISLLLRLDWKTAKVTVEPTTSSVEPALEFRPSPVSGLS
jgi:hypothetical protein